MSWLVVMWFAHAIFNATLVGNDEIGVPEQPGNKFPAPGQNQKLTKNAREAAIVDANLHPDRCFHYNASKFEDDIYLDKGEKVAIIIQNITDKLPVVNSCGTISNFCSHMLSGILILYVNFSRPMGSPVKIIHDDYFMKINLLSNIVTERKCTTKEADDIQKGCQRPCECFVSHNKAERKCRFPWNEGEHCERTRLSSDGRKTDQSDCPADIQNMLNNGPAKYCKKHSSTPAIPTEDIRRSSYGTPIEAAVETTSKPGILKETFNVFINFLYSPIIGVIIFVLFLILIVNAFHKINRDQAVSLPFLG